MKESSSNVKIQWWMKALLFVVAVAIIVQFFPRRSGFSYSYSEGRPWNYDLMTAPYDFAILKDPVLLKAQQAEALKSFELCVRKDTSVESSVMVKLNSVEDKECVSYLKAELSKIYSEGVVPSLVLDTVMKAGYTKVKLLSDNNVAVSVDVATLNTVRSAYSKIMTECPANVSKEALKAANVSSFLSENLYVDTAMSNKQRAEILKTVSLTSGMIQAGERIVDKGEIVTAKTELILNSLKLSYEERESKGGSVNFDGIGSVSTNRLMTIGGETMAVAGLMVLLFLYISLFRPKIFKETRHVLFILLTTLVPIVLATLALRMSRQEMVVYIVPFALVPIVIRSFFDSRTALFAHMIATLCAALVVPSPFEFALLQITAGMAAVSSLKDLTTRSQLARAAFFVFIDYSVFYIALQLIQETNMSRIAPVVLVYFGISALLLLFAYGLIFLFERLFGYLSPVSLVELSNVNTPLLLRFAELAPGTFQHSLQVANLVTTAAPRINANALLARVGAMYHDIGKLQHPDFFTENQMSGVNPLAELDPLVASELIIAHVKDGVTLAKAYKLPEPIIDFIRTHHADGRTKYFYNTYVNAHPDEEIPAGAFDYAGPKPQTKEQALLMMADSVEAASRSMVFQSGDTNGSVKHEDLSDRLDKLVDNIIDKQLTDGLLNDANITFAQVGLVKESFKAKLKMIYHTRISYPELKRKTENK